MNNYLVIFFFILSFNSFGQTDSVKISKLKREITSLQDSLSSMKADINKQSAIVSKNDEKIRQNGLRLANKPIYWFNRYY